MLSKFFKRFMCRGMQFCDMSVQAQSEGQEALVAPAVRCPGVHPSTGVSSCADKGDCETAPLCALR